MQNSLRDSFGLLPFVILGLGFSTPSAAGDCDQIQAIRSAAYSGFKEIKTSKNGENDYNTSLTLPGAKQCHVESYGPDTGIYSCEWYIVRDQENEAKAKEAYSALIRAMAACVPGPHDITQKRYSRSGEYWSVEDKGASDSLKYIRNLEVDYSFFSSWWTVRVQYERTKRD